MHGLSLALDALRCGVWASHCGGFSCHRTRALGLRPQKLQRVAQQLQPLGCKARLNRGARAQLLLGMWDLSGSGVKSTSPAMAGGSLPLSHEGSPPFALTKC